MSFHNYPFKVDCDTVESKFWVQYAAVNKFPKVVFGNVKITFTDSTFTYHIRELLPVKNNEIKRFKYVRCFFTVRKNDCKVDRYKFITN
jgi:hypothetical protein